MAQPQLVAVLAKSRGVMTSCRSCGKPITFFRTWPKNKAIPFDTDPVALKTGRTPDGEPLEYLDAAECHFTTCPEAERFRRPR